jgi:hypothetical protein
MYVLGFRDGRAMSGQIKGVGPAHTAAWLRRIAAELDQQAAEEGTR